jgi:hypothetical protein
MKIQRNKVRLKFMTEADDPFMDASPEECVAMVWELTKEVWSLRGSIYVERRLPRHVTKLIRP